jgi:uncharacterized protein (TIGR02687 family)
LGDLAGVGKVMNEKIINALNHQFTQHRIIFWYDKGGTMEEIYQSFQVPENGIKILIENNEFAIRHTLLIEQPQTKALIYSREVKPVDRDNWLLDLNLAHFLFASDEAAMIMQDLELDNILLPLIRQHEEFFRNRKERLDPLKSILNAKENLSSFKEAMLSVLCGKTKAEREKRKTFPDILISVLLDFREGGDFWSDIQKFDLEKEFWTRLEEEFAYTGEQTPDGLLNELLTTLFDYQQGKVKNSHTPTLYAHFDNWRKHQDYSHKIQTLLDDKEVELNIKGQLDKIKDRQVLVKIDLYKAVDRKIFTSIYQDIVSQEIVPAEALQTIVRRRETYWFKSGASDKLLLHYDLLESYLFFKQILEDFTADFTTVEKGWENYTQEYFKLDNEYRHFLNTYNKLSTQTSLNDLLDKIEAEYTESYLQPLADAWHTALDKDLSLSALKPFKMTRFFNTHVRPYLDRNQSVFVLITDGFRYDMGSDLAQLLEQKNRFQVELTDQCAPTPSYTQLGMAALLPHEKLSLSDEGEIAYTDDQRTNGWENRMKVIQNWLDKFYPGKKVRGMAAKEFHNLSRSNQNDFIRQIDIVYLWSSGADAIGDNQKTEENLPKAADEEIHSLAEYCSLIGKSLSRAHILITGDHGFLFRYKEVPETERCRLEGSENATKKDHRFFLSSDPVEHSAADILDRDMLEWEGNVKAQIARGVTRIRSQGGGTRYVHGGRMLQELCVPVLTIRKTRSDDIKQVGVVVIGRQNRITTGQHTVNFHQESPVSSKSPGREMEIRFEGADGKIISEIKRISFDSEDPIDQNRSRKEEFKFTTEANNYDGQTIYLKLYDIRSGDVKVIYQEYTYQFQKRIQMEIDF